MFSAWLGSLHSFCCARLTLVFGTASQGSFGTRWRMSLSPRDRQTGRGPAPVSSLRHGGTSSRSRSPWGRGHRRTYWRTSGRFWPDGQPFFLDILHSVALNIQDPDHQSPRPGARGPAAGHTPIRSTPTLGHSGGPGGPSGTDGLLQRPGGVGGGQASPAFVPSSWRLQTARERTCRSCR